MQLAIDFTQTLPPDAQARIADGMRRADEHANPQWRHWYDAAVMAAAKRFPRLTSDDVLEELEHTPGAPSTHNLAAIGPAMQRAAVMGILARTDEFRRSRVPRKNGNLHQVWSSRVFQAQ